MDDAILKRFDSGKLYYWKPNADTSILCRCVLTSERTISMRILGATPEQIIRWNYGPGEVMHFVPGTVPFEGAN